MKATAVNLVTDREDLLKLRRCGLIVAEILDRLAAETAAGVTTAELDALAGSLLRKHGALSAPREVYEFPGNVCISLNDEAVHGVPSERAIAPGDLVKLDVTVIYDGWITDAARSLVVPPAPPQADALARCSETALLKALALVGAGRAVWEIGLAVETTVKKAGFRVLRQLCGHGVGRTIHELPIIPNFYDRRYRDKLRAGHVITVEPILAVSTEEVDTAADGWTLKTRDGSLSSHFEHSIAITAQGPVVLTLGE